MQITIEPYTYDEPIYKQDGTEILPSDGLLYMPDCQYLVDNYDDTITQEVLEYSEELRNQLTLANSVEYMDIKISHDLQTHQNMIEAIYPILLTIPSVNKMEIGNLESFDNRRKIDNHNHKQNIQHILDTITLFEDLNWHDGGVIMVYLSSHYELTLDDLAPLYDYENKLSYSITINYVYNNLDEEGSEYINRSRPDPDVNNQRVYSHYDEDALVWNPPQT